MNAINLVIGIAGRGCVAYAQVEFRCRHQRGQSFAARVGFSGKLPPNATKHMDSSPAPSVNSTWKLLLDRSCHVCA